MDSLLPKHTHTHMPTPSQLIVASHAAVKVIASILRCKKKNPTVTAPCAAHGPLNAHTPFPTQGTSVQPRGQQIREQNGLFAHPATEPLGRAGPRARKPSVRQRGPA
jgi:hypothetical protein